MNIESRAAILEFPPEVNRSVIVDKLNHKPFPSGKNSTQILHVRLLEDIQQGSPGVTLQYRKQIIHWDDSRRYYS